MIAGRDEAWTTSRQMIILPGDDESSYHRDDSRDALTVDEMLSLHVGGVGRAQVRHFMLASLAWVPAAFLTLMSVFTERNPAWRGARPYRRMDAETMIYVTFAMMNGNGFQSQHPSCRSGTSSATSNGRCRRQTQCSSSASFSALVCLVSSPTYQEGAQECTLHCV